MLYIKPGAKMSGLRPEILLAAICAERVFDAMTDGHDLCITEATGGKHGVGSLHYVGCAIDIRTRGIPPGLLVRIRDMIAEKLGTEYDVVLESDHIHIEFQPK
jgi:hypothetical protein